MGSIFTSRFLTTVIKRLSIKHNLSTSFHPQTARQIERTDQTLEHFLRTFTNYQQTNWTHLLPFAEFAYNNSHHASISTPILVQTSHHPNITFSNLSTPDPFQPAIHHSNQTQSTLSKLESTLSNSIDSMKQSTTKKSTLSRLSKNEISFVFPAITLPPLDHRISSTTKGKVHSKFSPKSVL